MYKNDLLFESHCRGEVYLTPCSFKQYVARVVEELAIYEFKTVNDTYLDYISYYPDNDIDGDFIHVRINLYTGEQTRTRQKTTKRPYNYITG